MEQINKKSKLIEVIFLQTIGPLFVILGHSINGLPANNIALNMKDFIYVFHMPLFFFIAGITFCYSFSKNQVNYFEFVKKKMKRLLIPYFFLNLMFIIPKYFLGAFLVDNVELSFKYIIRVFLFPRENICGHLWFLVAIFITYIIAPLLYKIRCKQKIFYYMIFIGCVILSIFPISTQLLSINDLCKDFVFFLIGMEIFTNYKVIKNKIFQIITLISFIVLFILWFFIKKRVVVLFLGVFVLLNLLILGYLLSNKVKDNIISKNSYLIYIFHWLFMLTTRIVFYQLLNFKWYIVTLLMILFGIVGPLIVVFIVNKFKIREKHPKLSLIIGG